MAEEQHLRLEVDHALYGAANASALRVRSPHGHEVREVAERAETCCPERVTSSGSHTTTNRRSRRPGADQMDVAAAAHELELVEPMSGWPASPGAGVASSPGRNPG